jgi:hypothetical protein
MRLQLLILLAPFLSLQHQVLYAQGTSHKLYSGMYVSQTIGQQSVIGNYTKDGKTFGQGLQQSLWNRYIGSNSNNSFITVVYPNSFVSTINFQFSQPIEVAISVNLFDVRGRLIFTTENTLTLDLPHIEDSIQHS